jgi:transcriptional regulator with XRE-family HTH domain
MELSKNLRRLRQEKQLTQEQAAAALGVSPQSVSRWECGTTFPDVTMLPSIAKLYCVTIDDLYRQEASAYANYAQRLGCVFEATHKPEDFLQADIEFRKLLGSGSYTMDDLRMYGILHQYMMQLSMEKGLELFDRGLKMGREKDPETYWCIWRQKISMLSQIGRGAEAVAEFLPRVQAGSDVLDEWICLIHAYDRNDKCDAAWEWAQRAVEKFPESAMLHIYCGDLCKALGRYEEAFFHWQRAKEMEPTWMDSWYAMGFCYEELEDYEKAVQMWESISDDLAARGFEEEVLWPRERAQHCREKIQQ